MDHQKNKKKLYTVTVRYGMAPYRCIPSGSVRFVFDSNQIILSRRGKESFKNFMSLALDR